MPRKIKVIHKKLGRTKSWGWAHADGFFIEVDTRARGKKHLEIIVHESLHLLFPQCDEEEIEEKSITLINALWDCGYRRTDNDNKIPLQDGSL